MNLYYTMIADLLHPVENKKEGWKPTLFILLTTWLGLNFLTLFLAIQIFSGYNIDIIIVTKIEKCLPPVFNVLIESGHSGHIIKLIPCICIVYFSVFFKKRYIYISRKYHKHENGKLFLIYLIVSPIIFFGLVLLRDYFLTTGSFGG